MARKLFFLVLCFLVLGDFSEATNNAAKYIFINETSDHRFDESIRVSIMAAFQRTQVQNAVVISDDVTTEGLEKKAAELFSKLRVGEAQKGRGILYFLSPQKKLLKIEVGYALEGVLPDISVKGLELAAKTFIYTDRYQDFWAELINTLNIEIQDKEKGIQWSAKENFDFSKFKFLSGGAGIASTKYDASSEQMMREVLNASVNKRYKSTNAKETTLENYLSSLKDGVGDNSLDLLSKESRIFRSFNVFTSYQLFRNWRMSMKAGIDRIFEEKDLAFVFFKPVYPVLPIVLKKENGKWKIHEPLSWSLFQRFEDSNKVFLKYPLEEISDDLKKYLRNKLGSPLYDLSQSLKRSSLEKSDMKDFSFESLYFQFFWLARAADKLEGRPFSKISTDQLWMAIDIYMNLGEMTKSSKAYIAVAERFPKNKMIQKNAEFYKDLSQFKDSEWRLKR